MTLRIASRSIIFIMRLRFRRKMLKTQPQKPEHLFARLLENLVSKRSLLKTPKKFFGVFLLRPKTSLPVFIAQIAAVSFV
jgi:hypothetical protein